MGQSQSSSGDTPAETEQPLKRDYYELLSVERTATDEEIKKAYRRRALELHPDRNYGNEEGATRLFAEIQAAYEVLSDPQERAWYDNHRDVLLRGETVGGEHGVPGGDNFAYGGKMTSAEEVLKLMMKFNSRIDFSDAPSGFYGGLKDFFEVLAKEEDIAAQWEDEENTDYPSFGAEDDGYADIVRPFYAVWSGFATKKSYAWKDKWKLSDAPERRIRRLMEKENRKIRDEAIFEFNDAVRSLVAFVRKRDPRVQNNQKSEAERQKALKDLAAAQAARSRAQREAEIESFNLPEWARSREQEPEEHAGGFSSEEEEEQHEYECVVCDKVFKSEKQFQAHEKSKKHIKSLKELQKEMRKEGKDLDLGQNGSSNEARPVEKDEDEDMQDTEVSTVQQDSKSMSSGSEVGVEVTDTSTFPKGQIHQPSTSEASSQDDADSDYAPRAEVERRLADNLSNSESDGDLSKLAAGVKSSATLASRTDTPLSAPSDPEEPRGGSSPQPTKVGKAKQKRAKKAAAAAAATTSGDPGSSANGDFRCAVCGGRFTSKTKLFKHIDENNHAAAKGATTAAAAAPLQQPQGLSQAKGGGGGGGGKAKRR